MHKTFLIRNDRNKNGVIHQAEFSFWLWEQTRNCEYKTVEFSFTLEHCNDYQTGSRLTVVGSYTHESDKGFFGAKRLTVHTVANAFQSKDSVKGWLEQCMKHLMRIKATLLKELKEGLPEPVANLVGGMVFGGAQELSSTLSEDLRTTGLTHVVSASGYNVSVVVAMGMIFLKKLPRRCGTVGALLLVGGYAAMASMVPPVVRAAVMTVASLLAARVFWRTYQPGYTLLIATIGLIWWQPWYLKSLSFWLSVTATAGIILVLPRLESIQSNIRLKWLVSDVATEVVPGEGFMANSSGDGDERPSLAKTFLTSVKTELSQAFLTTLAAQSFSAPLVLVVFGQLSVLSVLTNTILLWLTPLITLSGLGYMLIGVVLRIVPVLHQAWLMISTPFLVLQAQLFLTAVSYFGKWTWGVVTYQLPIWTMVVWWGAILGWTAWARGKKTHE